MRYGEYLRTLLGEVGMTQKELAAKSGVGKTTIGELVSGRSKSPSFANAKRIADAMGVPLQQFADNVDED